MHEENILGNTPKYQLHCFITKSGNPPSENQYFSTFQIPLDWRIFSFNISTKTMRQSDVKFQKHSKITV